MGRFKRFKISHSAPESWKPRSCVFFFFHGIILLLCFGLGMILAYYWTSNLSTCHSKECIETANDIRLMLNETVDPCQDFYKFACGMSSERANVRKESVFLEDLRLFLEKPTEEDEENHHHITMAKQFYKSCMNLSGIEARGLDPLTYIFETVGGWPVLEAEKWNKSQFNWVKMTHELRELGMSSDYLMDINVAHNPRNTSEHMILISQPEQLGLYKEYFAFGLKDPVVQAYYEFQVNFAILLGAELKRAAKDMLAVLRFEEDLAAMLLSSEKLKEVPNEITVLDLQESIPFIDWLEYIRTRFPGSLLTEESPVLVYTKEYLENLQNRLNRTSPRILANYLLWRVALWSADHLNNAARSLKLNFFISLYGFSARSPRHVECIQFLQENLSRVVEDFYVREHFKEEESIRSGTLEILEGTKCALREIVKGSDWIQPLTVNATLGKLNKIQTYLGYVSWLRDETKLSKECENLKLENNTVEDSNAYFFNILYLKSYEAKKYDNLLSYDHKDSEVEAYLIATGHSPGNILSWNTMTYPAQQLEWTFRQKAPNYINYGKLGWVIGHELAHTLDADGILMDASGNYNPRFWDEVSQKAYKEKADCFKRQYDRFSVGISGVSLKVNGNATLSENMSDAVGIKAAYLAYSKCVVTNQVEKALPGLKMYTKRQLFWISAAQFYCEGWTTNEYLRFQILTGVHSPNAVRVQGAFANSDDFARDFSCPVGSPMNPAEKCTLF